MKTWPSPRILNASASALLLAGIGLLYAGALRLAPLALFAGVLLFVLAAIATTAHDIERLQAAAAPSSAPTPEEAPGAEAAAPEPEAAEPLPPAAE